MKRKYTKRIKLQMAIFIILLLIAAFVIGMLAGQSR
jgi:archaellum component FlaG (FlaF/FlaG flagellin family)